MGQQDSELKLPQHGARLVKASDAQEAAPPPHPDRALYEKIIGLRWAELRAYYNDILGHPPKCKNCGHIL